jgi:hypothetical protein
MSLYGETRTLGFEISGAKKICFIYSILRVKLLLLIYFTFAARK